MQVEFDFMAAFERETEWRQRDELHCRPKDPAAHRAADRFFEQRNEALRRDLAGRSGGGN